MAAAILSQNELDKAQRLANTPKCEQYDKMVSGMLYDAFDQQLVDARFRARAACHKYNHYFPEGAEMNPESLIQTRFDIIKDLFGHVADDQVYIEPPFYVDYGCNISLGKRFYANFNLTILDSAVVTVGDRVMIGPGVTISAATHEVEVASRMNNVEFAKPITIGNDCWIGGNVVILPGVVIGEGCTIGAGSVVTRDIPPWSVAVGSPARVVKKVAPVSLGTTTQQ